MVRTRAKIALAAMLCIPAGVAPTADAATVTRPDFKLPFQCGTFWQASTYAGHGAAIDLNLVGSDDRGAPVVAAAAGHVALASPTTGTVVIDHGGGWVTRYLHMNDIRVTGGRKVSEGQWIGRVSDVGKAQGAHLHFEVRRDGVMVLPVVDGTTLAPTPSAPIRVKSTNCLPGVHGLWFANSMIRSNDGTIDYVTPSGERYWVPDMSTVGCLQQAGVALRQVNATQFASMPRNLYGDPAGRWSDCSTPYTGWMIRGSGPAVYYVASTGFKYHVPNESTVMCLGGWNSVRSVSDGRLDAVPTNSIGQLATCQTPLHGRLVKGSQDRIDYVDVRGRRHYVPTAEVVRCLGGFPHVLNVRNTRRDALPVNSLGSNATCNTPLLHRLIRVSSGQVDYVTGSARRYWVPNGSTVGCLGGWASTIHLRDSRFAAIPRNDLNEWATCDTKWSP